MSTNMIEEKGRKTLDNGEWRFFPHIILRSTGFPLALLNQLSFERTKKLIMFKEHLENEWAEAVNICKFHLKSMPQLSFNQRGKIIKQLNQFTWPTAKGSEILIERIDTQIKNKMHETIIKLNEINNEISNEFNYELIKKRQQLKETYLLNDHLQEAVYFSSPNAYKNGIAPFLTKTIDSNRTRSQRRKEQLAAIYLQRFTSKNETASYYGPTNYGTFTFEPGNIEIEMDGVIKRSLFISYWAVQTLADKITLDPNVQPFLKPKLSPFIRKMENELIQAVNGTVIKLPNSYKKMVDVINGDNTIKEIATQLNVSVRECQLRVNKLKEKKVVLLEVDFPTSVFEPFEELKKIILNFPNECETKQIWVQIVNEWSKYIFEWKESSSFEQRRHLLEKLENSFEKNLNQSPRKDDGKHYTDRLIVYEEAKGDVKSCTIGKEIQEKWKQMLSPVFKLLTCRAAVEFQSFTEISLHEYTNFKKSPSFISFALKLQERKKEVLHFVNKRLEQFDNELTNWLKLHIKANGKIELTDNEIDSFCENYPKLDFALFSPDVMVAATSVEAINKGDYQLVLGEVHSGIQTWSVLNSVYPKRDELNREVYHHLGTKIQSYWLEHVGPRAPGKTFRPELSEGKTVEHLGRSVKSPDVLSIADLDLVYENNRFYVVENGNRRIMDLETDSEPINQIFSLPSVKSFSINFGTHTPRIEMNGVIYQRERWEYKCSEILRGISTCKDWELLQWAHKFKQKHRMPRCVYVKGNNEPKPIFLDFYNFFTLEIFSQMIKRNESVVITEMTPSNDNLWFEREENKHTSEFRFTVAYEKQ